MNTTARMLAIVPTMPETYRTDIGARRASSNSWGLARLAKKMSRKQQRRGVCTR
jgi:hypothetical protein